MVFTAGAGQNLKLWHWLNGYFNISPAGGRMLRSLKRWRSSWPTFLCAIFFRQQMSQMTDEKNCPCLYPKVTVSGPFYAPTDCCVADRFFYIGWEAFRSSAQHCASARQPPASTDTRHGKYPNPARTNRNWTLVLPRTEPNRTRIQMSRFSLGSFTEWNVGALAHFAVNEAYTTFLG